MRALALGGLHLSARERHGLEDPFMPHLGLLVGLLDGALVLRPQYYLICWFRFAHLDLIVTMIARNTRRCYCDRPAPRIADQGADCEACTAQPPLPLPVAAISCTALDPERIEIDLRRPGCGG